MRFSVGLIALVALIPAVMGAPTELLTVTKYHGKVKPGSYIVFAKTSAARGSLVDRLRVNDTVKTMTFDAVLPNAFAVALNEEVLNLLRADPDVESIYEDGIATGFKSVTQANTPWGLQRISQDRVVGGDASLKQYNYKYDSSSGENVDVYVLDTGINIQHVEFGGRARYGATFVPSTLNANDDDGHGTHCAGIVGGNSVGVAKNVNLIAVKVLDSSSKGSWSQIIAGMEWAYTSSKNSGKPSIFSMSLGSPAFEPADQAVGIVIDAGIHVVVGAGNDGVDADNISPARAKQALTVAASDINDKFATYSNYGPAVKIIAPGSDVISTWIGSNTAYEMISGTSMATPHVAGVIATTISQFGNTSPANMTSYLVGTLGLKGVIQDIRGNTPNVLLRNEQ